MNHLEQSRGRSSGRTLSLTPAAGRKDAELALDLPSPFESLSCIDLHLPRSRSLKAGDTV